MHRRHKEKVNNKSISHFNPNSDESGRSDSWNDDDYNDTYISSFPFNVMSSSKVIVYIPLSCQRRTFKNN